MWSSSRLGDLRSNWAIKTSLRPDLYMHGFSPLNGWAIKMSFLPSFYMLGLAGDMSLSRLTNHYTTLTLDRRSGTLLPLRMPYYIVTLNNNFPFILSHLK